MDTGLEASTARNVIVTAPGAGKVYELEPTGIGKSPEGVVTIIVVLTNCTLSVARGVVKLTTMFEVSRVDA